MRKLPHFVGLAFALMLSMQPVFAEDFVLTVAAATTRFDPVSAEPAVDVTLTADSAKLFGKLSADHVGDVIEVWVDGELVSSPVLRSPILGGVLAITGSMTPDDATDLAQRLSAPGAVITLRPVEN